MTLGIIAEDESDVQVIQAITVSLLKRTDLGFKHFVGHGCGKLRRKCESWSVVLTKRGCTAIVVVHDLDSFVLNELRAQLEASIKGCKAAQRLVLIPRKELEAWLLYDPNALSAVFGAGKAPRLPGNPEMEVDPKKTLGNVVEKAFGKKYISTIHNSLIAARLDVSKLKGCASFSPYIPFAKLLGASTPTRGHISHRRTTTGRARTR